MVQGYKKWNISSTKTWISIKYQILAQKIVVTQIFFCEDSCMSMRARGVNLRVHVSSQLHIFQRNCLFPVCSQIFTKSFFVGHLLSYNLSLKFYKDLILR